MAWREQAPFGNMAIHRGITMREGGYGAPQGGIMVGVKAKLAVGTGTMVTAGEAVKNVAAYTLHEGAGITLADKGLTVNTTLDRIDVDFIGTKFCLIQGKFSLDVGAAADVCVIQVMKNGSTVLFESPSQNITAATPLLFTFDFYDTLSNGDYLELWVENEDEDAVDITVAAYADTTGLVSSGDAVLEHGYMQVTGW